jgi:2-keto-3-deoxy-L-rhamnonate aldolase RhmA
MTHSNPVKAILAGGGVALGASTLGPTPLVAKLTATTGVDFVWIDTEHASFGTESIELLPPLIRQSGPMPLVRVAGLDPQLIKKALDIGAQGIMIPQINTAEEARRAVDYAMYPPQGSRGISPMWTFYNDVPWSEYLPIANEDTLIVAQVESAAALSQVEAIAAVEGVDVVLAGPMDLSAALGHIGNIGDPEVQEFLASFPGRVARAGKAPGIALGSLAAAEAALSQGYRFINFANVVFDGVHGIKAGLAHLRALSASASRR